MPGAISESEHSQTAVEDVTREVKRRLGATGVAIVVTYAPGQYAAHHEADAGMLEGLAGLVLAEAVAIGRELAE